MSFVDSCRKAAIPGLALACIAWLSACTEPHPAAPATTTEEAATSETTPIPVAPEEPGAAPQAMPAPAQWVYLDEDGNRIARPEGAPIPGPAVKETPDVQIYQTKSGGEAMRFPHMVYSYATKAPDGTVEVKCVTQPRDADVAEVAGRAGHVCGQACTHVAVAPAPQEGE